MVSETHVCESQLRVFVCVSPGAVVVFAVASIPALAYDEFGGDLLA